LTNLLFAEVAYGGHPASHAVDVTPKGWKVLRETLGIHELALL
jgi:hypothetical protein